MKSNPRILLPLLLALAAVGLGVALSACGSGEPRNVKEGEVLKLGDLEYTVLFSRYLNPNDTEDTAYLQGLEEPEKAETYFGLFLLVQNDSEEIQILPKQLKITDAEGDEFEAVPTESDFAFPLGGEVPPQEQIPILDSPAQQGPIEGSAVVFDLPDETSGNRPLILHVENPSGSKGEIELDL